MRFFVLTAVASLLSAASAANITVIVGKDGGLSYTPNSYDPIMASSSFRHYGLIIGFAVLLPTLEMSWLSNCS